MKLHTIHAGYLKLDGGAMFGVVPKALWNKQYPADENNMIPLAMRLMLVEQGDKKILINTGIGNKQGQKFFSHFHLHGDETIDKSLAKHGFNREDITDVFHTHLHFDHCGGTIVYDETKNLVPAFPNATLWVTQKQWDWANNPNEREAASFLKENILPMQENGKLKIIDGSSEIAPGFKVREYNGHTIGQAIPFIDYNGHTVVFTSDLLAFSNHIRLPWIMSFDIQPLVTLEEKKHFLREAADNNYILFFEHDKYVECARLTETEKGIRLGETYTLDQLQ
ncbi:MAG: MBL fold metallo-hydrolase [Bacteroidales bacterium]|nr:MBL fold metallo-hydrolase [Bacteroidales bacterium]